MGIIKDRNGMDLTKPEDIKKSGKNTQKNYTKKYLNGVLTHLEPDILECKVKWALGSITTNTASGGDQRRQWHPTPVLLPGEMHGQRSLVGCSQWGR